MAEDVRTEAPTRLALVRHGESRVSVARSIGGARTCTGMSDLGRRQCERLAARLAETGELAGAALYASHYQRAIETAEVIAPALGGAEIHVEDRFGEHDPGPDCDGLTFAEFIERHGMPDWEADPYAVTFPGGETIAELHHRVALGVRDVMARHAGGTVVVCCHGGVINAVLRLALKSPGRRRLRAVHDERLAHRADAHAPGPLAPPALQRRRAPRRAAEGVASRRSVTPARRCDLAAVTLRTCDGSSSEQAAPGASSPPGSPRPVRTSSSSRPVRARPTPPAAAPASSTPPPHLA